MRFDRYRLCVDPKAAAKETLANSLTWLSMGPCRFGLRMFVIFRGSVVILVRGRHYIPLDCHWASWLVDPNLAGGLGI